MVQTVGGESTAATRIPPEDQGTYSLTLLHYLCMYAHCFLKCILCFYYMLDFEASKVY